jgi:hypothetical protein
MSIQFYDVRKRAKVDVPETQVRKKKYERETKTGAVQIRFALVAEFQGAKLTKFVSEKDWNAIQAPLA